VKKRRPSAVMKKRLPDLPWSDIESGDELHSIFATLEGSPQPLVARLRAGLASKIEQALVADLIEGKIKPQRPRPGGSHGDRLLVAVLIRLLEKLWTVPNMENAYLLAALGIPPTCIEIKHGPKLRKVQRKAIHHLALKIVGSGSKKVMGARQAYYALTEFDDVAISRLKKPLRQILKPPDPEMETLIQVLLTPDSELQNPDFDDDDDDDDDDGLLTPHPDG